MYVSIRTHTYVRIFLENIPEQVGADRTCGERNICMYVCVFVRIYTRASRHGPHSRGTQGLVCAAMYPVQPRGWHLLPASVCVHMCDKSLMCDITHLCMWHDFHVRHDSLVRRKGEFAPPCVSHCLEDGILCLHVCVCVCVCMCVFVWGSKS